MSSAASAPKKNLLVGVAKWPQGQSTTLSPTFYGINKVTPPKTSGRTVARNKGDKSSPPLYTTGPAANPAASPPIQAETKADSKSDNGLPAPLLISRPCLAHALSYVMPRSSRRATNVAGNRIAK